MSDRFESIDAFIQSWQDSPEENKRAFIRLKDFLSAVAGVRLAFVQRPGVTYSLRASHVNQQDKPLFVLVDVIEDEVRWLSICFYAAMIDDPLQKGDEVPQGLLGEDALCFDIEAYADDTLRYIEERLEKALQTAALG